MQSRESKPRAETAEQILDLAETLIQTRGYSAFSYQDIALALGIRKASIHYHFASKTALGIALVERYVARFAAGLEAIAADESQTSIAMLDFYAAPYLDFARRDDDRICLCGALAGEMMALPRELRRRVDHFFQSHQAWLATILERGARRGEFTLAAPARKTARLVFGALQGALLVKRTTGDITQLRDVIDALKAQLAASPEKSPGKRRSRHAGS